MRVAEVTIHNVLGITERTFKPGGKLTEFRGKNGSGKTSALEALRAALEGGDVATLARVGAEGQPEIVLVLDDGTRVKRKGKGATVEVAVDTSAGTAYAAIKKPQAHLDGLFDTRLSNPVRFLTAPPQERAELLLAALPLELDLAALWEELPPAGRAALEAVDIKAHPLQVLGAARQRVFELRTDINRSAREKAASADQLAKSLPTDAGKDWNAEAAALEAKHEALAASISGKLAAAGRAEQEMLEGRAESRSVGIQLVNEGEKKAAEKLAADAEAKIEAVRKEHAAALVTLAAGTRGALQTITDETDAAKVAAADIRHEVEKKVAAEDRPELDRLTAELATARTKAQEAARTATTREMAEKFAREAEGFKAHAEELGAAIATLDAAKTALAKELPIPGLEIVGRDITVDGIPFDSINTAGKWRIAFKVATLRLGKLPVVFLDGAEVLDSENYAAMVAEAERTGCQAFVAKVTDGPFEVVTDGEVVTA